MNVIHVVEIQNKMTTYYTTKDVGCHIDNTYGESPLRQKLSNMTAEYNKQISQEVLIPSDDDQEIYTAISLLQDHTETGLIWLLEGGDLLLIDEILTNTENG